VSDALDKFIANLWRGTPVSREAQAIRAKLSLFLEGIEDDLPEWTWDLIDIAVQRGIDYERAVK
jgi:hypothetical protein